jgi:ribonuclease HII
LNDSKKLTAEHRQRLKLELAPVCDFGEGWVSASEINRLGLGGAMRLGTSRALRALGAAESDTITMDGKVNYCPKKFRAVSTLVAADSLVPIVSAASIYAKVLRDEYMASLSVRYPLYGFERHVGYGTKQHRKAIADLGVLQGLHRINFAPFRKVSEAEL